MPDDVTAARLAIYFAPSPESALWQLGSSVLGYDAYRGVEVPFPREILALRPDWHTRTTDPRTYGFHATLRAPFHVREGSDEQAVLDCVREIAGTCSPFSLGEMTIAALDGFVALVPVAPPPELAVLESACVLRCAAIAAPLSAADRKRRLRSPLTERQRANLDRYGYPYVFDDFRFHMTLSNRLPTPEAGDVVEVLAGLYREIAQPIDIDAISVFRQPDRGARFQILARIPLGR